MGAVPLPGKQAHQSRKGAGTGGIKMTSPAACVCLSKHVPAESATFPVLGAHLPQGTG